MGDDEWVTFQTFIMNEVKITVKLVLYLFFTELATVKQKEKGE